MDENGEFFGPSCVLRVCVLLSLLLSYLENAVGKKVEVAISQVERMPNILQAAVLAPHTFSPSDFSLCSSLVPLFYLSFFFLNHS